MLRIPAAHPVFPWNLCFSPSSFIISNIFLSYTIYRCTEPLPFLASCMVQRPTCLCYIPEADLAMVFGGVFCQSGLHLILSIKCHYMSSEEVLKQTTLPSIGSVLFQTEVHWTHHLAKTDASLKKSFSENSMKEGTPVVLPESIKQTADEMTYGLTGVNQPSVMAAGGLRLRQLVLLSEKGQSQVQDREA